MSASFSCHCAERSKPLPFRRWAVWQRGYHCSAFAGYQVTPSDYSTVFCRACGKVGRTKAGYVAKLPDGTPFDGKGGAS